MNRTIIFRILTLKSVIAAAVFAAVATTFMMPISAMAAQPGPTEIKQEIKSISDDVTKKRQDLQAMQKKQDRYREMINQKKADSASLEDDIGLIDNEIAKTQIDIDIARQEISTLQLETSLIDSDIKMREAQMARERVLLGGLARKMYFARFRKSELEILLSNSSLSGYFDDLRSVTQLQSGVQRALIKVKEAKSALDSARKSQEEKRLAVEDRKRSIETSQRELSDKRSLKDSLLLETKSSELEYRYLLADLVQEQGQADSEIQYLEKTLREKISVADQLKGASSVLSWPVDPSRGVSTKFHDPDYPFRYVFEHPGIDIRAGQGTPVRAAAAGVVARAKNGGMAYSYVMLIHNGDLSTVYGHLSRIVAKEDTFVERGEIIGYSGGMPGTPGAGPMTTGPHLHFEARVRGIPQDPMRFLVAF